MVQLSIAHVGSVVLILNFNETSGSITNGESEYNSTFGNGFNVITGQ